MTLSALALAGGVDRTRVAGRRGKVRARNGLALGEEPAVHESQNSSVVSVEMHPRHRTGCRRFNFAVTAAKGPRGTFYSGFELFRLRADAGGLHTFPLPPAPAWEPGRLGPRGLFCRRERAAGSTRRWTCSLTDYRFDRQEPHAAEPRLHRWSTP
jgi:hypothetical protein